MERHEIEIFLTLAEELHFGRTAERLHVSGALVSKTVKKVERRVGAALFERTSRRVALTPAGQRLYDELRPAYEQVRAAVDRVVATGRAGAVDVRADPAAGSAADGSADAAVALPARELPNDVAAFVGREAELAVIAEWVGAGSGGAAVPVVAIDGAAGAGKSALAVHAAHRVSGWFPDGQLYANLRGASPSQRPVPPVDVLVRFLRSLGLAPDLVPAGVDEAAARFRSLANGRRLLVVLDDAAGAAQVRPLLPADPGCAVLVTSRRPLTTLDGAVRLRLGRLPATQSLAMLERLTDRRFADAEPDLAGQLVRLAELCDHLPLALRIAAARLAAREDLRVAGLVGRLEDARRRLDELSAEDIAVRASLSVEYAQLDDDRVRALSALSAVDVQDVDLAAAAAAVGQPAECAEPVLERLVEANLLESTRPGRYGLHDLPRLFVREQAGTSRQPVAVARLFGHYLATLRCAMRLLHPGLMMRDAAGVAGAQPRPLDGRVEAARWLATEELNLAAIACQAADCPTVPVEAISAVLALLGEYADRHGHRQEWYDAADAALRRARRDGDRQAEARLHSNLGVAAARHQRFDEAQRHLEHADALLREGGDRLALARLQNAVAWVQESRGGHDRAELSYQEADAIYAELGNQRGRAGVWSNLGRLYTATGRAELALPYLRRARRLLAAQGDHIIAAYAANNLGDAYRALGHHRAARACYECGLAQSREHGSALGEAYALTGLGRVNRATGRVDQAVDLLQRALASYEQLGAPNDEAAVRRELSEARAAGPARHAPTAPGQQAADRGAH